MENNLSKPKALFRFLATALFCSTLSCCGIPIETSKGIFKIGDVDQEELRRNHQNPSRMIEDLDSDRRSEISDSIDKQNKNENAARDKKLNDIIDKQLRVNGVN